MTQLCFEISVGLWLNTPIAKEWSEREMNWKWPNYLLPVLHPTHSWDFDAARYSDINNTQILECTRSFSLSSCQFAYLR